jgi:hypothetical protein
VGGAVRVGGAQVGRLLVTSGRIPTQAILAAAAADRGAHWLPATTPAAASSGSTPMISVIHPHEFRPPNT